MKYKNILTSAFGAILIVTLTAGCSSQGDASNSLPADESTISSGIPSPTAFVEETKIKYPTFTEQQIRDTITRLNTMTNEEFYRESAENRLQWCSQYTNQIPQHISDWTSVTNSPLDELPAASENNSAQEILMISGWYDKASLSGLNPLVFNEDPEVMAYEEVATGDYILGDRQKVLNCKYFKGNDERATIDASWLSTVDLGFIMNDYADNSPVSTSSAAVKFSESQGYVTANVITDAGDDLAFILVPYVDYLGNNMLTWELI